MQDIRLDLRYCFSSPFGLKRTDDTGGDCLSNSVFRQCPVCTEMEASGRCLRYDAVMAKMMPVAGSNSCMHNLERWLVT
eukprot:169590-Pelagomonas_calceolata.AAC.2